MPDAFQRGAFQPSPAFQMVEGGLSSSVSPVRIPRWLLKFERTGKTTYLTDVGGELGGPVSDGTFIDPVFWVPAVAGVSLAGLQIDLERMAIPNPSATVRISPSALEEFFLDLDDLGQAVVTIYAWDGRKAYPIIKAKMEKPEWGYDGETTSFSLTEEFSHNPNWPRLQVGIRNFSQAQLADGARFRIFPIVWGNVDDVPMFALLDLGSTTRYMIAGHGFNNATVTGPGTATQYRSNIGEIYIGAEFASPPSDPYWNFRRGLNVLTASDLFRQVIKASEYPEDEIDTAQINHLRQYLSQFAVGGYLNEATRIWGLVASRFQLQFLFVVWQQAGKLIGAPIDPSADPRRVLVFGVHLLQLQHPVKEETKYTGFKVRYRYLAAGNQGAGWYGLDDNIHNENEYLRQFRERWGYRQFGDPIEVPLHAASVDLSDVTQHATAHNIAMRYAQVFHRGQLLSYLQLAEFSTIPFGTMVALVDEERGLEEQKAILVGREWLTPELVVQTFRTIHPLEEQREPEFETDGPPIVESCVPTFGPGSGGPGSAWDAPIGGGTIVTEDGITVFRAEPGAGETSISIKCDSTDCVVPDGYSWIEYGWFGGSVHGTPIPFAINSRVRIDIYDCETSELVGTGAGSSMPGCKINLECCGKCPVDPAQPLRFVLWMDPGDWQFSVGGVYLKFHTSEPDLGAIGCCDGGTDVACP